MKKTLIAIVLLASFAAPALADQYVNGYTRRDGTYVGGHYRSSPNGNFNDNYSTYGNTNPYTGEPGTRRSNGNGCSYGQLC